MVDKNEVYLIIKIKYQDKKEEIKTSELLSIDEIKDKIIKIFSLDGYDKKDLYLFYGNNNKELSNSDNIFFLSEKKGELYYIDIDIKTKGKTKKNIICDSIKKTIEDIIELDEKIKKLQSDKEKMINEIKINELKYQINIQKSYIQLKENLVTEIEKELTDKISAGYNTIENKINEIIKNETQNLDNMIKEKVDELKNELEIKIKEFPV
jgi:hypothetical protein